MKIERNCTERLSPVTPLTEKTEATEDGVSGRTIAGMRTLRSGALHPRPELVTTGKT